ncbi:MAG TPA: bacteriohopanetetrol glucosamine biosynthesis glycosyltransferase HpnI [Terriglobales bacterium]|nr:bacteriohopanetetrol glucosamine biosynthesis glycosyltransferase HpnI [Terriglobales bacterium]
MTVAGFVFGSDFLYNLHLNVLAFIAAVLTGANMAYCALCIWAAARFASQSKRALTPAIDLPPVSILKPLKGTDPEMHESFRSHCIQDYPEYEILFGISDASDPAAALVEKLQREFPHRAIRLVLCEKKLGVNGKVSSLAQLAAEAKYQILLVNDSDIRVTQDYLKAVVTELQEPGVGMVTCLYRGVPAKTIASRLESLGISTDFVAGVLAAKQIEGGLHFGLGSTLAFRRGELEAIGGFEAIVDYLADDYELGKRIADLGMKVALGKEIVETFLPAYSFSDFFSHQLRWARTIRVSRPGGYAGLLMTHTMAWAILTVVLSRGAAWAWGFGACAVLIRIAMAIATGSFVLRDKELLRSLWLLPLRDLIAPFVWLGGLFGRKITWRGEKFKLDRGRLSHSG